MVLILKQCNKLRKIDPPIPRRGGKINRPGQLHPHLGKYFFFFF